MEYLSKILMEQRAMSEIFELKDLVCSGEIRFKMNETFLSNDYSFDEVEFHIMTYYSGNKDHWLAFDSGKKRSVRLTKGTGRGSERKFEGLLLHDVLLFIILTDERGSSSFLSNRRRNAR